MSKPLPEPPGQIPVLADLAMAHEIVDRIGRLQGELAEHLGRVERTLAGHLPERLREATIKP